MTGCQAEVHKCGEENGVMFDSGKEAFMVLHHVHGSGDGFKLLGTTFDAKLVKETVVAAIVGKAGPKLTALLRTSAYYDVSSMVQSLKNAYPLLIGRLYRRSLPRKS